ncbi:DUF3558 domain-containing protein [Mycolicibacterium sp. S2-37]|uniref:DUF3558 domain-containing protein n=1 Tax=Mycolicibacterium sp. S2-37 TaxID=2810297 RepID=UPI001A94B657|nr:DUF3558 domain-containing protein [Mycolicibacterium sp. S2-37]MBO0679688.1 DUF3558 domain-containing protein [Mycolicibacterium sp. S2-37]
MHGVTPSTRRTGRARNAKALAALATALIPVVGACSDSGGPSTPEDPQSTQSADGVSHGPFFPQCGGISDETISQITEIPGLKNTATTSVGCQWLTNGSIVGPHFSFTWFRGSPIGRERKTEELSRTSVEDINIEGHDGFLAIGDDLTLGTNLCEIGIQFGDDFIEWSVTYDRKPFPDPCEVAKELTRQSIVNSK